MLGPALAQARDRQYHVHSRPLKHRVRPSAFDTFAIPNQTGLVNVDGAGTMRRAMEYSPMNDVTAIADATILLQGLAATPLAPLPEALLNNWAAPHHEVDNEDALNVVRASDSHEVSRAILSSAPFVAACAPHRPLEEHFHAVLQRRQDPTLPECEPDTALSWGAGVNQRQTLAHSVAAVFERKAAYGQSENMSNTVDTLHANGTRLLVWREPSPVPGGNDRICWRAVGNVGVNVATLTWLVRRFAESTAVALDAELDRTGSMRGERYAVLHKTALPQGAAQDGAQVAGPAEFSRHFGRRSNGTNLPGPPGHGAGLPNHVTMYHGHALRALGMAAASGNALHP